MALTYQQIWERYSKIHFSRRLYIKRLNEDGTYEADFTEISQGLMQDGSVSRLSRQLPNSSYAFGKVAVSNASLNILSAFQEFAGEEDPNSVFAGFIRHWSIVKVVDSLVDYYTDPDTPVESTVTTFQGLLDANTATTEQGFETITALDFMTVLDEINVNELTLSQTTINNIIYEIMNRSEFTKYFNVSNSTTYINAGYNATSIDVSQYDGTVLEMIEDLSRGHSIFYINPDDNYFYFVEAQPTATSQYNFLEMNNRKLSVSKYRSGIDRQINQWFWKDTSISSIAVPAPVNPRIETLDIKGVTNATQRQNLLDFVLSVTKDSKPYFRLEIPYLPTVQLLDKVVVQSFGQAPPDAIRWGMFQWTDSETTSPATAARWRKPAGIRISADEEWMIRGFTHANNLKTTLKLEKIL